MEHIYNGQKIEIHTEQVGKRWDWWFVLNDRPPRYNAESFADTEEEACRQALNRARKVIDQAKA